MGTTLGLVLSSILVLGGGLFLTSVALTTPDETSVAVRQGQPSK